jgi:hypothetical protein
MLCALPPEGNAETRWDQGTKDGALGGRTTYQSLTLLHVLLSEQKLTVKVGKVDGVEIEQGNVTESGKHDVLDWQKSRNRLSSGGPCGVKTGQTYEVRNRYHRPLL